MNFVTDFIFCTIFHSTSLYKGGKCAKERGINLGLLSPLVGLDWNLFARAAILEKRAYLYSKLFQLGGGHSTFFLVVCAARVSKNTV